MIIPCKPVKRISRSSSRQEERRRSGAGQILARVVQEEEKVVAAPAKIVDYHSARPAPCAAILWLDYGTQRTTDIGVVVVLAIMLLYKRCRPSLWTVKLSSSCGVSLNVGERSLVRGLDDASHMPISFHYAGAMY